MRRVHSCAAGLLLAVCTGAWAGGGLYPPLAVDDGVGSKTRAEVIAELQEAIRSGKMYDQLFTYEDGRALAAARALAASEAQASGQSASASSPDVVVVWGDARSLRTRIQAEAAEANRLGLLAFGEGDPPVATAEQEELIAAAGRRAIESYWVVGSL
jgi:hypothetical protein